jgi:2-polyprenyl-6-methoxyphenol hydroxylase-like FAD-dependent oxidoreductase
MTYTGLVIGGGIAGTLGAVALHKAGMRPVIYEAHDGPADNVGAFLTLAVNALDALRVLEIDIDRLGFETPWMTLSNGSGRRLGELPYGPVVDGMVSRTVKRAELYLALRDEVTRRGLPIEYGKRLVSAERTRDGVRATFADGTTAEGDLLIGADGLRSRTREIIDPGAPGARYAGLLNTGGCARGVPLDTEPGVMHAIFGKRCFFCYTRHPNGEVWWAANPARATEPTRAELAAITSDQWREQLTALVRRDRGPAADLIAATSEIFAGWPTYEIPSVPRWHRDRMVIVGDAAHATAPSIGQGAAMAIEDVVELARCLRDGSSVESAFATYELRRRDRVERVVRQGNRTGGWKSPGPVGRIPRDVIMRLALKHRARSGADPDSWMYEHHIDWAAPAKEPAGLRPPNPA